jgi:membrane protein
MLTWMWASMTILIAGAELNAEAERQTKEDSTGGSDDSLGRRNATAADAVGYVAGDDEAASGAEAPHDDLSGRTRPWLLVFCCGTFLERAYLPM